MIHAKGLSSTQIGSLASYLKDKWAVDTMMVAPPPPAPLAPLSDNILALDSWAFVEGTNVTLPAQLQYNNTGSPTCLTNFSEIGFTGAVDTSQVYVLKFKVGSV